MNTEFKITRKEFRTLAIVVVVGICGTLGIDIHLASMPHIMRFMHTDQQHIQQSVSVFLLGMGISLLFYGPMSDRFGRKPPVILGLSIAAVASFAAAFTTHIEPFLLARLFQGIGSGVCIGLGRTIIADVLQGDRFAVIGSYFNMFLNLSPLFAPAMGGYIQHWFGWQMNFVALGVIITSALLLYALGCPETNHFKNPQACHLQQVIKNYRELLGHRIFMGCTFMTGIAVAVGMIYATLSAFIFQIQFHMTPVLYGWLTAIAGVAGFIGRIVNTELIKKMGGQKTLLTGFFCLVFAGLWLLFFILIEAVTVPVIMIAVFMTMFSQCFVTSNCSSKALSPFHSKRGSAGALYGSFQMIAAFFISGFVGALAHDGVDLLGVSFFVLGILGVLIYFYVFKPRPVETASAVA
jgi:DHA1 family 2-module integral membrane pump EmrD-like MFS transporter